MVFLVVFTGSDILVVNWEYGDSNESSVTDWRCHFAHKLGVSW